MLASAGGHTEIVKLLLAYGSDVNEKDSNNQATALIGASAYGYVEIMNLLIKKGADPNAKNRDGLTSISIAAINGHLGAVKVLIEAGANIDVQDEKYGANALIGAAANGHDAIIKLLLDHRAKVNLRANNGLTALGFAKEKNRKSTVQHLQNFYVGRCGIYILTKRYTLLGSVFLIFRLPLCIWISTPSELTVMRNVHRRGVPGISDGDRLGSRDATTRDEQYSASITDSDEAEEPCGGGRPSLAGGTFSPYLRSN